MPINGNHKSDQDQWIFLMNGDVFEDCNLNIEKKPTIVKLRHPKTDSGAYFMFTNENQDIYELVVYKEDFRSWLIDNTVQHDGSLFITTPVDPVFMVLPYLIKAEKSGKFMTLDQIVLDDNYPECNRLTSTAGLSELYQVADIRGEEDLQAYKYNKEKTLSWLKLKTEKLSEALSDRNFSFSGSHCAMYVRSKRTSTDDKDCLKYAFGMVSEYLPDDLSNSLREYLGLPVVEEKKEEPPTKKSKNEVLPPDEDYSKNQKDSKPQKEIKLTQAQKQLSKVDKSGMKSISSFFSPKTKT